MPYDSSLVRLDKKAVPRKGPCPDTRRGPWATCPLLIQQAVAAAAYQKIILVMWQRELLDMITRVRAPFSTSLQRFQLQATLSLFHIIRHKSLTYNTIPILSDREVAENRASILSEIEARNENRNRHGSDRRF